MKKILVFVLSAFIFVACSTNENEKTEKEINSEEVFEDLEDDKDLEKDLEKLESELIEKESDSLKKEE